MATTGIPAPEKFIGNGSIHRWVKRVDRYLSSFKPALDTLQGATCVLNLLGGPVSGYIDRQPAEQTLTWDAIKKLLIARYGQECSDKDIKARLRAIAYTGHHDVKVILDQFEEIAFESSSIGDQSMVELFLELVPAKLGAKLAMVDYQDWESFRRSAINEAKYLAVIEKEDNLLNIAFSRTNLYNSNNRQSSSDKPISSSCFNCGGRGHHSNVCPSPRPSKGSKKGPSKHRHHHSR